ncbi:MAG: relaxase/mobilization nuclease domain-containing protein [Bdellovibrionales bacterium]
MIIKSHIRGGYRAAADYFKDQGENEKTRIVEISDPSARNLDEAFHNMWVVSSNTRATKPLHHISINPMKDERLTDKQVLAIVERCEQKYGYKLFHHQRVIIEHVKDGRQHFHVMWNRVSLYTGTTVWPGEHWKKSKQVCREMEKELGLKSPKPRQGSRKALRAKGRARPKKRTNRTATGRPSTIKPSITNKRPRLQQQPAITSRALPRLSGRYTTPAPYRPPKPYMPTMRFRRRRKNENIPDSEKLPFRRPEWDLAELLSWAWETKNYAVLASFGIHIDPETFEP